mmetsp:Transcript_8566/g.28011  ORF Transcript_8566/g.28011 Transcript_8566/m.28011 type:complete len:208 (-) Transcript_8566:1065-1688(-)
MKCATLFTLASAPRSLPRSTMVHPSGRGHPSKNMSVWDTPRRVASGCDSRRKARQVPRRAACTPSCSGTERMEAPVHLATRRRRRALTLTASTTPSSPRRSWAGPATERSTRTRLGLYSITRRTRRSRCTASWSRRVSMHESCAGERWYSIAPRSNRMRGLSRALGILLCVTFLRHTTPGTIALASPPAAAPLSPGACRGTALLTLM